MLTNDGITCSVCGENLKMAGLNTLFCPNEDNHGKEQLSTEPDLTTTEGAKAFLSDYFLHVLERRDFCSYIEQELAGDFAFALAPYILKSLQNEHHLKDRRRYWIQVNHKAKVDAYDDEGLLTKHIQSLREELELAAKALEDERPAAAESIRDVLAKGTPRPSYHGREPLSPGHARYFAAIVMNPGAKLNGEGSRDAEGNAFWVELEQRGMIRSVGSYKFEATEEATEALYSSIGMAGGLFPIPKVAK